MSELPKGWEWATLDAARSPLSHALAIGPFGSNLKVSDYRDEGVPLVFVRNIRAMDFDLAPTYVTHEKALELAAHRVLPRDVLITKMGDPPGDSVVYPAGRKTAILTADCIKVTTHPSVLPEYVCYAIQSPICAQQIAEMTSGVAQQKVSLAKIRNLRFPLSPHLEQQRIVAALEEAFSKLAAGESGLRVVRERLRHMRDVILAAAVIGHLVPQDPTDTPASGLLADLGVQQLADETMPSLPVGWSWVSLGSVARSVRNGLFVSRPAEHPPGVPILRIGSVRRLSLDTTDIRYATVDPFDTAVQRASLCAGDLLFTRYNGNPDFVGACAIVPQISGILLHPDKLIRVVTDSRIAVPAFVAVAASAGLSRAYIESVTKTTAGQVGIAGGELKKVPLPLPPIAEQLRIVAEVERQLSFVDACERAVGDGIARSSALRRSVLKAAFEGSLVPQDPSDEPAAALLDRIRAERDSSGSNGGRRGRMKADAS